MVSEANDPFGKKGEGDIKEFVSDRFTEHLGLFTFFDDFSQYCETFSPDITNIANLVTLGNSFDDPNNYLNVSSNSDKVTLKETHSYTSLEKPSNAATVLDGKCEGKFVSPNVINFSKRHLFKGEISLLSNLFQCLNTLTKRLLKKNLKPMAEKLG